jgi:hypothetical protein
MSDTYDASDPATVDSAAKEAARQDREDTETFRVWMNHPKGRDLLYRIAYEVCHLGEAQFVGYDQHGRSDTHRTYLDLGMRNAGAWLDDRMRRHPDLYAKMLAEQEVERQLKAARLKKQNERRDEREAGNEYQWPSAIRPPDELES